MTDAHAREFRPEDLAQFDLNLLVALDMLVRERSVTAAAQRLGVTQSAVSHALRRLRECFDDPLLLRGRKGLTLTPRAEALALPLRNALDTLGHALLAPEKFVPSTARRSFCLATPDLFDAWVIPLLLEDMRRDAPFVDLTIVSLSARHMRQQLESSEVDAAIVPQWDEKLLDPGDTDAPNLVRRALVRDHHGCLIRSDHPVLRGRRTRKLTVEAYAGLQHMVVSPLGGGPSLVDHKLSEYGLRRRVALRIPHFYSALGILAQTDLVLTAPSLLARVAPRDGSLTWLDAPLRLPGHRMQVVWHERFTKDAAHIWLRERIASATQQAQGRESRLAFGPIGGPAAP